jgi:ribosomal protein S6--L-glutamate ligase
MKKIGRFEKIFFPNLNEPVIRAKVDTGAFNAALHVDSISVSNSLLSVTIGENTYHFSNWTEIKVKSSNGTSQNRFAAKMKIRIGSQKYSIFVSFTDRKSMKFRFLIGRRFLMSNNFIVDVNKKCLHGRPKTI